ncbi:tetratricopeptide repeat protein 28-like [Histomonas meleagridis]|uniref:tetratricopeptide repeat protein 28-like n=1 Tax=Histomonas meleagridis TaxID=135588 RepID=UPI0035593DC0|nr:tetratricopeptide repeat protein 28-like [Histomonas meleagridis]KAH0806513.1 tetratricopeptide repeat protein 28-like [Histomonas meleagridis]
MEDFTFPLRSKITEITDLSTSIFNYSSLRFDLILSQSFPTTPEFEEPEVDPNNKKQMFDDAISQTIIAINNKDSKTASLNIQKALKLDPRSPIPYQLQVRLHFKFHRFKSAVEVALNAYRHFPNDYTCLSLLGKAKQRVGAHNEAIEYFKRLLLIPRNRPLDFESINHSIAKSLFMLGKLDESYTLIYPIYKSNHSNLKASVLLAQIYAEKGLLRDALHIIIKNFSIDPDHKQSCRFIGNHIINDRQAIVLAEELGDGMKNPHILFYVGNILYTHGSCKVADYFFRRALKILPFDPAIFVGTFRNFISLRLGIEQCNEMINLLMDYLRQQNDELSTITQDNDNGNNDSNYVEQKGTLECPFKLVQLDSICVNPILAATFSRKIRTLLKEDPTIREFSVYPKQGDFECIAQIFTTARIQFSDRLHYDPEFMYIIASQLQIDFLLPQLEDDYIDTLDPQKALEGLNLTNQFGAGIDIHIKYIASHIYKFETQALEQEIKDLDPNLKDMIFTSSYLPGGYGLGNNNIVENSEKKLSQMSQEEYCEFVSDPTVDLNKERAMFIELLDSNIRN